MHDFNFHAPIHIVALSCVHIIIFYSDPLDSFWNMGIHKDDPLIKSILSLVIHVDATHLWNNLAIQLPFGCLFEMLHSHIPCILIFWTSGLFGALLEIVFLKDKVVYGGASPGDFALVSAFIGHVIINWQEARFKWIGILFISLYAITNLILAVFYDNGRTAHLSHLGGFLHGILTGIACVKNYSQYSWETKLRIVSACLAALSFVIFCFV